MRPQLSRNTRLCSGAKKPEIDIPGEISHNIGHPYARTTESTQRHDTLKITMTSDDFGGRLPGRRARQTGGEG